jgi:hypothetical protein
MGGEIKRTERRLIEVSFLQLSPQRKGPKKKRPQWRAWRCGDCRKGFGTPPENVPACCPYCGTIFTSTTEFAPN